MNRILAWPGKVHQCSAVPYNICRTCSEDFRSVASHKRDARLLFDKKTLSSRHTLRKLSGEKKVYIMLMTAVSRLALVLRISPTAGTSGSDAKQSSPLSAQRRVCQDTQQPLLSSTHYLMTQDPPKSGCNGIMRSSTGDHACARG